MTIDGSALQISVQEEERWHRRMSVTVPASVVRDEENKAAQQLAARASLKGFRKGRVPKKVIESRFGGALRREALDRLIGQAYREALASEELRPISEGEIHEVNYEPDSDLVFSISFDVQPQITLDTITGFALERPVGVVEDSHVDEILGRLQDQHGDWAAAEEGPVADGNLVEVKLRRITTEEGAEADEGKEYEFTLGQGDALPDIENGIRTLGIGESGEFEIAFPDDYPDEERRGDVETVEISLLARKERELPELTDEFAKKVGDFESLDALKDRIREDLEKDAEQQSESVVRGRLLELIIDANPFEVPVSMLDRYIDSVLGDQRNQIDEEKLPELMESIRPEAERAVKRIMAIELVAEQESLAATEDDVDDRVEEIAAANDSTASQVYAGLQKAGRLEQIERELTETKVFDFLKERSDITDAPAPQG